jgi:predicted XRE-type DNA-binding protein
MSVSLNAILAVRKLTQAEAARVLDVNQPKVSALICAVGAHHEIRSTP